MTAKTLFPALAAALTPATFALVMQIATAAERRGAPAYLVGGPVRDMLLNQPVNDIDIVFEGDAMSLAKQLAQDFGGDVVTHERFGTAKWYLPQQHTLPDSHLLHATAELPLFVDLITARRERYKHVAALPTVTFDGIEPDLFRRDFTLNTLALRLNGEQAGALLDFYQGEADLRNGIIRILHDDSFRDDPTRIFRAIRFEQRLDFRMEPHTETLLQHAIPLIDRLTPDRLRHEIDLVLAEAKVAAMLTRLEQLGGLGYALPGVTWGTAEAKQLAAVPPTPDPQDSDSTLIMGLAALLGGAPKTTIRTLATRLGLSNDAHKALSALAALQNDPQLAQANLANSALYTRLRKENPTHLLALSHFTDSDPLRAHLTYFLQDLRHRLILVNGDDLKALGIPTGKHYQRILETVTAAVMDGTAESAVAQRDLLRVEAERYRASL